jgi:hypothetical protein
MFTRLLLTSLLVMSAQAQAQLSNQICTREYAPVCGQLGQETQTFPTRCVMLSQGGTWVSDGACPATQPTTQSKEITLTVAAQDVACMGAAPMRCLQVKEGDASTWSNFYSRIEDFTFTPGVRYTLLVRVTPIHNPPADMADTRYELVRELSRSPTLERLRYLQ